MSWVALSFFQAPMTSPSARLSACKDGNFNAIQMEKGTADHLIGSGTVTSALVTTVTHVTIAEPTALKTLPGTLTRCCRIPLCKPWPTT